MGAELIRVSEEDVKRVREEKVVPLLESVRTIEVHDQLSYEVAMELGRDCAKLLDHVEGMFKPAREAAHKAWKSVTELSNGFTKPIEEAKKGLSTKISTWQRAEEARVREEQRKAREEEQRKQEELLLAHATELEAQGQPALADAMLIAPPPPPPEPPPAVTPTSAGSVRANWKAEVVDLKMLVDAVAAGKVPLEVLEPNTSVLGKLVKTFKGAMNYPGVRVWDEGSVVYRR